jgi:hypothetical protein
MANVMVILISDITGTQLTFTAKAETTHSRIWAT